MIIENDFYRRYLTHIGAEIESPSIDYLNRLITLQIKKFPFENISKLILWHEQKLDTLVDHETHLTNSIMLGLGGTCYANNYYFNRLLNHLGFAVSLHGADMIAGRNVHAVSIVEFENEEYLVDVGYGAPFYSAVKLTNKPHEIAWGELKYIICLQQDERLKVLVMKCGDQVHEYVVNKHLREISYFNDIIKHSFRAEAEFMKILRVIKYFDDHSIELKNFKVTTNYGNKSHSKIFDNIDELENCVHRDFQLPNFPIMKANNYLKGVNKL